MKAINLNFPQQLIERCLQRIKSVEWFMRNLLKYYGRNIRFLQKRNHLKNGEDYLKSL